MHQKYCAVEKIELRNMLKLFTKRLENFVKEYEFKTKELERTFDQRMEDWKNEQIAVQNERLLKHINRPRMSEEDLRKVEEWKKKHNL